MGPASDRKVTATVWSRLRPRGRRLNERLRVEWIAGNARPEGIGHVTTFIRELRRHPQTISRALVIVVGVLLLMEFLGQFLPVLGNPLILLMAGSLLALWSISRGEKEE